MKKHIAVMLVLLWGMRNAHVAAMQFPVEQTDLRMINAAKRNNVSEVKRLLTNEGVDVNQVYTKLHLTALHVAASRCCVETMHCLLQKEHINVNMHDINAATPLHAVLRPVLSKKQYEERITVIKAQCTLVKMLLQAGVEVNAQDSKKNTALHYAVGRKGCGCIIELLVKFGAKSTLKNSDGLTPLVIAAESKRLSSLKRALACTTGLTQFAAAVNVGETHKAAHIVALEPSIIAWQDKDGYTCAHYAAQAGNSVLVDHLIALKARVNLSDLKGYKPVDIAWQQGHFYSAYRLAQHAVPDTFAPKTA